MRQSASAITTCAHAPRPHHNTESAEPFLVKTIYVNTLRIFRVIKMLVKKVVQLVFAAVVLWRGESEAATSTAVKLCGRQLSEIMSRVCHAYNSPSWDVPTVVEQPGTVARRKRQLGIVDECCVIGCTWEQLSEYCSITAYSESPFEDLDTHNIADRSAEVGATNVKSDGGEAVARPPAAGAAGVAVAERERRREELVKSARAAPVVGTVSPLITWGRTLNTDLPTVRSERDRYAYVVYT